MNPLANNFPFRPGTAHVSANDGTPCILCYLGFSRTFPCQTSLLAAETRKQETVQCAILYRTSLPYALGTHWQQATSTSPQTETIRHQLRPKEHCSFPCPLCADSNSPQQPNKILWFSDPL